MNKLIPLPFESVALTGYTHKVMLDYVAVAALAGTTAALQIVPTGATLTNPAGLAVLAAALNLTTAFDFSDAAVNSLLIEVGDGVDPNRFLGQTEIAVDGTEILFEVSRVTTFPYAYTAADGIDVTFTVAGGASPTLAECTSGAVEIYLKLVDLNDLELPT